MGLNELLENLKQGEIAEKFQGCESVGELVDKAKELGYEVSAEDVEGATDLSDETLASIAGGRSVFPVMESC